MADHEGKQTWQRASVLILPRAKDRFVSVASIRKRQLSSMCCKRINASREKTSSTDVHEEKPGEREREEMSRNDVTVRKDNRFENFAAILLS